MTPRVRRSARIPKGPRVSHPADAKLSGPVRLDSSRPLAGLVCALLTPYGKKGRHPGGTTHDTSLHRNRPKTTRLRKSTCPLPGAPPHREKKRHRVSHVCFRPPTRTKVPADGRMTQHQVHITFKTPSVLIYSRLLSTHEKWQQLGDYEKYTHPNHPSTLGWALTDRSTGTALQLTAPCQVRKSSTDDSESRRRT